MVRFLFDHPISINNGSWSSFEAASSIIRSATGIHPWCTTVFLLYENHLSNDVTNSRIATFADDTKIFKTINSKSDALSLCTERSVKFP